MTDGTTRSGAAMGIVWGKRWNEVGISRVNWPRLRLEYQCSQHHQQLLWRSFKWAGQGRVCVCLCVWACVGVLVCVCVCVCVACRSVGVGEVSFSAWTSKGDRRSWLATNEFTFCPICRPLNIVFQWLLLISLAFYLLGSHFQSPMGPLVPWITWWRLSFSPL